LSNKDYPIKVCAIRTYPDIWKVKQIKNIGDIGKQGIKTLINPELRQKI